MSGFAAADALLGFGATVTIVDEREGEAENDRARVLEILGAKVRLGPGSAARLPGNAQLVVTSPGWRPTAPLLVAAGREGVPIWGEVELAWRLRDLDRPAPWLAVTGTNGKTTTVRMLAEMLRASGLRATAAGNVGDPVVETVLHPQPYDVIALELSSYQLHWVTSMTARSAAVLNVAPDHLDWHGSLAAYTADKGRIYRGVQAGLRLQRRGSGNRRAGPGRGGDGGGSRHRGDVWDSPRSACSGIVDGVLADRAFVAERQTRPPRWHRSHDLVSSAPHNVTNALAAAALARSIGVPAVAVRDGMRAFRPGSTPDRRRRDRRWDFLRRRLQSHEPACRTGVPLRLTRTSSGSPAGWPRAPSSTHWCRAVRDRLRGVVLIGADRDLARAGTGATRARGSRRRGAGNGQ